MKRYIAIGILVLIAAVVGTWAWRYFTAPISGAVGVQEQIQSAETRITAYNHFYDLYAAIQSYDYSIKALQEALQQSPSQDEKERIVATIAGLKSQRARSIAQYNVDAQKSYTIGQFRDWKLPYQVEQEN